MKRLVVIAATLLTLTGVAAVTATASSASVCQPDGTGRTKAGTSPGEYMSGGSGDDGTVPSRSRR
jgi:pectate lyase